ncbi:MAG: hypothetical protein O3B13_22825, partial [Planctomycetota bacterium]|nr:hypothetical protein [Planctomycetota bacterium]
LEADSTIVTLVNTDQLSTKTVIIQAGGYGEHQFTAGEMRPGPSVSKPRADSAEADQSRFDVNRRTLTVQLEPGCGARLILGTSRYVNAPTLSFPWSRSK